MSSNKSSLLFFLAGTAIGVSAGLYLNSKKGKEFRKNVANKASDLESKVEEKVKSAYESIKSKVNDKVSAV